MAENEEDAQNARLTLPDGTVVDIPLLVDAAGCLFLDVRKLQPR
jgi:hypothetical protein